MYIALTAVRKGFRRIRTLAPLEQVWAILPHHFAGVVSHLIRHMGMLNPIFDVPAEEYRIKGH